ncbi:MAG: hypothetical protein H5T63_01570 [Chloroflexi bacterium]|nr:hypothetical protein [Chloroflexota bacterium]
MVDFTIAPSALAYLFGDTLEDLFAGKARLSLNETIPCREAKVKVKDLANAMLVAAFVHLAKEGALGLTLGKKGMLIKSSCVLATRGPGQGSRTDGWEGRLLANLTGNTKGDDIGSIAARSLGSRSADPWKEVILAAQRYLVEKGYFAEAERHGIAKVLGKELVPQCEKIAALQGEAEQVKAMLSAFRASQPALYEQLWKDVAGGIASCQEKPDTDFD